MTAYFIWAIVAAFVLLIISTVSTMKNRYFENQVRTLSEQYARLSIDIKNETDTARIFVLHGKAEKLKTDIELMIGKYPKINRYDFELAELNEPVSAMHERELSLGELQRFYEAKNNSRVIYAQFNQENKDS